MKRRTIRGTGVKDIGRCRGKKVEINIYSSSLVGGGATPPFRVRLFIQLAFTTIHSDQTCV